MANGKIASAICFMLALFTVLSLMPVFLHLVICEFSARCLVGTIWHSITASARFRPFAIAMVVAPPLCLFLYIAALRSCAGPRDALDRRG